MLKMQVLFSCSGSMPSVCENYILADRPSYIAIGINTILPYFLTTKWTNSYPVKFLKISCLKLIFTIWFDVFSTSSKKNHIVTCYLDHDSIHKLLLSARSTIRIVQQINIIKLVSA